MIQKTLRLGNLDLHFETGEKARQANMSVYASYGDIRVLATICCGSNVQEGLDFVPLSVEYNERYYAAGKIPGGFLKREARPKDKEILVCRLIDRPMRPLFDQRFGREIQVVPAVLSADQNVMPDVIAMNAAFLAAHLSDIPFAGPIAAVRIAGIDGSYILNPSFEQLRASQLDIVVAGSSEGITMVEGGGSEVSEEFLLGAIDFAHETIKKICVLQDEMRKECGKEKLPMALVEERVFAQAEALRSEFSQAVREACFVLGKFERTQALEAVKKQAQLRFESFLDEDTQALFSKEFSKMEKELVRESILRHKKRTDGRSPEDIRPISCKTGVLPRAHGSALFTRGETQAMVVTTLGTSFDAQIMDDIDGDRRSRFMLHYNFPPYSVGETGRLATGRREIGHGHLAQRSIESVLPVESDFPYTVRIVSDIWESNGSSSMASVCGASLALFDAGVQTKSAVAGIAMGLVSEGNDFVVLSDILGEEDHLGDMDFKVAGTQAGITGFQMDIKIQNVSASLMKQALEQARLGRLHILGVMNQALPASRQEMSPYAPSITTMSVSPDKLGIIIGTGGRTVKGIAEDTKSEIDIQPTGKITIASANREGLREACRRIEALVEDPVPGRIYDGTVKKIMEFGAFIEILPGKEGLCHISKLANHRVEKVRDILEEGQKVRVRLKEIDHMGRLNLSMIDLD